MPRRELVGGASNRQGRAEANCATGSSSSGPSYRGGRCSTPCSPAPAGGSSNAPAAGKRSSARGGPDERHVEELSGSCLAWRDRQHLAARVGHSAAAALKYVDMLSENRSRKGRHHHRPQHQESDWPSPDSLEPSAPRSSLAAATPATSSAATPIYASPAELGSPSRSTCGRPSRSTRSCTASSITTAGSISSSTTPRATSSAAEDLLAERVGCRHRHRAQRQLLLLARGRPASIERGKGGSMVSVLANYIWTGSAGPSIPRSQGRCHVDDADAGRRVGPGTISGSTPSPRSIDPAGAAPAALEPRRGRRAHQGVGAQSAAGVNPRKWLMPWHFSSQTGRRSLPRKSSPSTVAPASATERSVFWAVSEPDTPQQRRSTVIQRSNIQNIRSLMAPQSPSWLYCAN